MNFWIKRKIFKKEIAPEGSTKRCTDGCRVEAKCPYSALKIYLLRKMFMGHLKIEASMESHLMGFKAEESRMSGNTVEIKLDFRD